jgi:hypothetical protein
LARRLVKAMEGEAPDRVSPSLFPPPPSRPHSTAHCVATSWAQAARAQAAGAGAGGATTPN